MKTHLNAWQRTFCRISLLGAILMPMALNPANGQVRNDSLPEVKVVSTRYRVPSIAQPQQVTVIGREVLEYTTARDLVTLLSLYGHAYLRSNGPGLASGLTQRGFGTTSFQVVRDGFALNQHMHGQVDMALIPVAALGFAEIATANASSSFGSAASGGSVLLGNDWTRGWAASHEVGPWGYRESYGSVVENVGRSTISMNGGVTSSENDYPYQGIDTDADQRRENSSLDRKWFNIRSLNRADRYTLRTNLYVHGADRGIPDPINFSGTQGFQTDEEVRLTTELSWPAADSRWSVAGQVWQSRLLYDDNWLTETSYNRVRGATAALNFQDDPSPWFSLSSAIGGEAVTVKSNNYESTTSRNALQASVRGIVRLPAGLLVFPATRIDVIEDVGTAVSPSMGVNKPIIPDVFHIRSQWSYNFTAPTLNDQFWNYGGNRELNAERAHKADLGVHVQSKAGASTIDLQVQAYLTRARNGIVWQPDKDGMWMPVNLQEMHSHGLEQSLQVSTRVGGVALNLGSQATWNRAYIPKPRFGGDTVTDKQLRYTPEWMLRLQGSIRYRMMNLQAELSHDGKRFSSEDHTSPVDPMPAYTVANFGTEIRLPTAGFATSIRASLINAFDTRYQTIAWYPMPGRHLLLALKVNGISKR